MPVRLALAALAAIVLGAAGCGGDEEARPDLAFVSSRDGDYAIFEMNADGRAQHRLTPREVGDITSPARLFFQVSPAWSPDATQIGFASRRSGSFDIYLLNADGSGAERISDATAEEGEPAWSPDGEWITYVRRTPGTAVRELWLMRADGTGRRALTSQNATVTTPAWSPDSSR